MVKALPAKPAKVARPSTTRKRAFWRVVSDKAGITSVLSPISPIKISITLSGVTLTKETVFTALARFTLMVWVSTIGAIKTSL